MTPDAFQAHSMRVRGAIATRIAARLTTTVVASGAQIIG